MRSKKYPKVPTGRGQLASTAIYLLLFTAFNYLVNPDAGLSPAMRRFMNREASTLLMVASILGAFGFLWAKKNKKKADLAARDVEECTEGIRRMTDGQQNPIAVAHLLEDMEQQKADAKRAKAEASKFDDVVAFVAISALVLVFVATVLQVWAA